MRWKKSETPNTSVLSAAIPVSITAKRQRIAITVEGGATGGEGAQRAGEDSGDRRDSGCRSTSTELFIKSAPPPSPDSLATQPYKLAPQRSQHKQDRTWSESQQFEMTCDYLHI